MRIRKWVAIIVAAAGVAACGQPGSSSAPEAPNGSAGAATAAEQLPSGPGQATIGSANFPESELLAYLYAGALQARGVKVKVHANIGERASYMAALADGSLDMVPEYSGALLNYLDRTSTDKDERGIQAALTRVALQRGYVVGSISPAQDVDTLTVTKDTAARYRLRTIGDLKTVSASLTLGAPAPFQTVPYGSPGLRSVYGVTFGRFVPLAPGGAVTETALRKGTIDVADIFSTDPAITRNNFVVLEDPKNVFAAENIVPIFRADTASQPMLDAADAVSDALTTPELSRLVAQLSRGADPAVVAKTWLADQQLAPAQ